MASSAFGSAVKRVKTRKPVLTEGIKTDMSGSSFRPKANPGFHPTASRHGGIITFKNTAASNDISTSSTPMPVSAPAEHGGVGLGDIFGGAVGFIGHLASDVEHTVVGLPIGLVHMATSNPLDTAKEIGTATWQDWAPLFEGHPGEWAHNFYEHPLAPILDVASVFTGGAAIAGRSAGLLGSIGERAAMRGATAAAESAAADVKLLGAGARQLGPGARELASSTARASAQPIEDALRGLPGGRAARALETSPQYGIGPGSDLFHMGPPGSLEHAAAVDEGLKDLLNSTQGQKQLLSRTSSMGSSITRYAPTAEEVLHGEIVSDAEIVGQKAISSATGRGGELARRRYTGRVHHMGPAGSADSTIGDRVGAVQTRSPMGDTVQPTSGGSPGGGAGSPPRPPRATGGSPGASGGTPFGGKAFRSVPVDAGTAGRMAGQLGQGGEVSEWWQKMQKFSDPAKYAEKTYRRTGAHLGFEGDALAEYVREALQADPLATRTLINEATGFSDFRRVDRNVVNRTRKRWVENTAEKAAKSATGKKIGVDKIVGNQATLKRWSSMDTSIRRTALRVYVKGQLDALAKSGEDLEHMTPWERVMMIHNTIRDGLTHQAHAMDKPAQLTMKEWEAALKADGKQFVRAKDRVDLAPMQKALDEAHATGDKATSEAAYNKAMKEQWPSANVAKTAEHAEQDALGRYLVVSSAEDLGKEALDASRTMQLLYRNPTKVWSYMLLGLSPRYFVNNFIGNGLMMMAATDPVTAMTAVAGHIRSARYGNKAFQAEEQAWRLQMKVAGVPDHLIEQSVREAKAKRKASGGGHYLGKWLSAEHGWAGENMLGEEGKLTTFDKNFNKLNQGKRTSLHYATHKFADMPYRNAAMRYTLRRMPEFQGEFAALKKRVNPQTGKRYTTMEAEHKAADMALRSPVVRQVVRQQVHHMMGQYHHFARLEKHLKNFVPFYAWDRAIAKHMKYLVTDQSYKVAMGAAIGSMGSKYTEQMMGQVPDFMRGAIPAAMLPFGLGDLAGKTPGRTTIFNTTGMNPYATVGELAGATRAVLPGGSVKDIRVGETLGVQLNPLLQGMVEQLSGTSLMTGLPIKQGAGGPVGDALGGVFGNLPQVAALKGLSTTPADSITSKGNPTLYEKNEQAPLSSLLGFPIRRYDKGAAQGLYDKQEHVKHPRKRAHSMPGY